MLKKNKFNLLRALTTKRLIVICFFGILFWVGLGIKIFEPDIWRHLATGKYILESGSFPKEEIFSYVASGRQWIVYSWLAEVIFYKVSLLGINWLILLRVFLIVLTLGIVLKSVYNLTGNFNLSPLIAISVVISFAPSWQERPQLFSFLFTSIFIYVLSAYKYKGKNYLWLLPIIMLFWVNLHIYFIVGLILIGLFIVGEFIRKYFDWSDNPRLSSGQIRELSIILLISGAVCFINPYTYRIFFQVYQYVSLKATAEISGEMHSPSFHLLEVFIFEIVLFISFLSMILSKRRPDLTECLIFFGFTHQSFYSLRNMPYWGVVAPSIFSPYLNDVVKSCLDKVRSKGMLTYFEQKEKNVEGFLKRYYFVINWIMLVFLIFIIYLRFPKNRDLKSSVKEDWYPIKSVDFIEENKIPGPMFSRLLWGSYLIYTLYPEYKVSFDGRTQVYGDDLLREYCQVHFSGSKWQEVLNKYNVNFILWKKESALCQLLLKSKSWKLIYQDELSVIFIRDIPENKEIIALNLIKMDDIEWKDLKEIN